MESRGSEDSATDNSGDVNSRMTTRGQTGAAITIEGGNARELETDDYAREEELGSKARLLVIPRSACRKSGSFCDKLRSTERGRYPNGPARV